MKIILPLERKLVIEAKEKGADIALFPEMRNDRYYLPQDENEIKTLSVEKNSRFIEEFRRVNESNRTGLEPVSALNFYYALFLLCRNFIFLTFFFQ